MDKYIKRDLLDDLESHLKQQEITLITGPRQAGKTTLMLLLEQNLKKDGIPTLFFNLDWESDRQYFETQDGFIRKIRLEVGSREAVVFVDEIQRKQNAGLFLKGVYDSRLPYKFVVSGSGSLELKEKIHESLAGRKRIFDLGTVSFPEFVRFKTAYRYENRLKEFFEVEKEQTQALLEEYLSFGGYPKVVLAETAKEKRIIIDEIFQSYLEKDLSYLLGLKKTDRVFKLIRLLAAQTGQIINYSRLAAELNVSVKTLKDYLWYGEKTFILDRLTPYFENARKEIVKSPKYYFRDLGLRNYALGTFGNIVDEGFLFENFVLRILRERLRWSGISIHFWRTKDRAEVDFILVKGETIFPMEVKYRRFDSPKVFRSLGNFIKKYAPPKAFVVNLNYRGKMTYQNTKIEFLPYWDVWNLKLDEKNGL